MSDTAFPSTLSGPLAGRRLPNWWDAAAFVCVFGLLAGLGSTVRSTLGPIEAPDVSAISLDPSHLPAYAARTTLRMFAALAASLAFTFTFAVAAAKSRRAGLILIPILDILQSVPILGFLTFTTVFFMSLFPGQVLGLELAAIFAIFTSQAWNMAFSMYQSLISVPTDLAEASRSFQLSGWQKFWKLEVPYAMPGLVWNTMMSMSGGWFFVVASEAISIGDTSWKLPGVGSYVATAQAAGDTRGILYAILTMLVVILLYDQLLFRPLVAWSGKFRFETTSGIDDGDPWVLRLLRKTHWLRVAGAAVGRAFGSVTRIPAGGPRAMTARVARRRTILGDAVFLAVLAAAVAYAIKMIVEFVFATVTWDDVPHVFLLGLYTMIRVLSLMAVATLVWVPIGVWLGLHPRWARRAQPVAQFLAAIPANLFFPLFVIGIVRFHADPNWWLSPLIILGTQWYILFNVIAGAAAFPSDLREASANFRVGGLMWWRRVIIPGIFPYLVTGLITASGGSWNAAIVAEVVSWKDTKLTADGLGAYIAEATTAGDMARVVLGVFVMVLFVLSLNRLVWRPLYAYSARRFNLA